MIDTFIGMNRTLDSFFFFVRSIDAETFVEFDAVTQGKRESPENPSWVVVSSLRLAQGGKKNTLQTVLMQKLS